MKYELTYLCLFSTPSGILQYPEDTVDIEVDALNELDALNMGSAKLRATTEHLLRYRILTIDIKDIKKTAPRRKAIV